MVTSFDISTIWLKLSYFFLANRDYFKKWWVILLVSLDVFIIIFAFTNSLLYLFAIPRESRLMVSMASSSIDYAAIRASSKPRPLELVQTRAIPAGKGIYDLVAEIQNTNTQWAAAEVYYTFTSGTETTETRMEFVMPDSQQFLTAYNIKLPAGTNGQSPQVTMSLEEVVWQRIPDLDNLPAANFTIEDVAYSESVVSNKLGAYWVTATVRNDGFNGFWQTNFTVVLLRGNNEIVGIDDVFFKSFAGGETKSLRAQWNYVMGPVSRVLVVPDINLLDADNVML